MRAVFAGAIAAFLVAGCGGIDARRAAAPPDPARRGENESDHGGSAEPAISVEDFGIAEELPPAAAGGGSNLRPSGRARFTLDGIAAGGETRAEEYASLSTRRIRVVLRRREAAGRKATVGFAGAQAFSGSISLRAGSFVPDFGEGLLAGGAGSPFVFSGAFPLAARRGIAPNTSFYGRALVGGAIEIRRGGLGAIVFAGRERTIRSGRIEIGPVRAGGLRLEARFGGLSAGISAVSNGDKRRGPLVGVDARTGAGAIRTAFEAACGPGGVPAACAAFSFREGGTRFGALLHSVPSGLAGLFSRVGGRDLGSISSYGGMIVMAERTFARRAAARAAVERMLRTGDRERADRSVFKIELEKKWRRVRFVVSGSAASSRETPLLPFPGASAESREASRGAGVLLWAHPAAPVSIRFAIKGVAESRGGRGLLLSPMLRVRSSGGRMEIAALHASYVASSAAPACYFYEPSLEGAYPWRGAFRSLRRSVFVFTYKYNKIEISYKVALQSDTAPEGAVQALAVF